MKEMLAMFFSFSTVWKVSRYGVFPGLYFPVFGLDTFVNLRVLSEYRKIRTRKNSVFGRVSRIVYHTGSEFNTNRNLTYNVYNREIRQHNRSFRRLLKYNLLNVLLSLILVPLWFLETVKTAGNTIDSWNISLKPQREIFRNIVLFTFLRSCFSEEALLTDAFLFL